jgi:hypothetical protein
MRSRRLCRGTVRTSLKRSTRADKAPGYFDGCPARGFTPPTEKGLTRAALQAPGTSPPMFSSIYPRVEHEPCAGWAGR